MMRNDAERRAAAVLLALFDVVLWVYVLSQL
jgi:hypothetical protein